MRLDDPRPVLISEVRPSLVRDFGDVGVDGGCLLDDIAAIDNQLNDLVGRW
jgi:hypothetical protein